MSQFNTAGMMFGMGGQDPGANVQGQPTSIYSGDGFYQPYHPSIFGSLFGPQTDQMIQGFAPMLGGMMGGSSNVYGGLLTGGNSWAAMQAEQMRRAQSYAMQAANNESMQAIRSQTFRQMGQAMNQITGLDLFSGSMMADVGRTLTSNPMMTMMMGGVPGLGGAMRMLFPAEMAAPTLGQMFGRNSLGFELGASSYSGAMTGFYGGLGFDPSNPFKAMDPTKAQGFGYADMATLANKMSARGLIGSTFGAMTEAEMDGLRMGDPAAAEKISKLAGARQAGALSELTPALAIARSLAPNADVSALPDLIQSVTGDGIGSMSPEKITQAMAKLGLLAKSTGVAVESMVAFINDSVNIAQRSGLDSTTGASIGMQSLLRGRVGSDFAMRDGLIRPGVHLSPDKLADAAQQMQMRFAGSSLVGVTAVAGQLLEGVDISGASGGAASILQAIRTTTDPNASMDAKIAAFAKLNSKSSILDALESVGVSRSTSRGLMDNQSQVTSAIAAYGLGDFDGGLIMQSRRKTRYAMAARGEGSLGELFAAGADEADVDAVLNAVAANPVGTSGDVIGSIIGSLSPGALQAIGGESGLRSKLNDIRGRDKRGISAIQASNLTNYKEKSLAARNLKAGAAIAADMQKRLGQRSPDLQGVLDDLIASGETGLDGLMQAVMSAVGAVKKSDLFGYAGSSDSTMFAQLTGSSEDDFNFASSSIGALVSDPAKAKEFRDALQATRGDKNASSRRSRVKSILSAAEAEARGGDIEMQDSHVREWQRSQRDERKKALEDQASAVAPASRKDIQSLQEFLKTVVIKVADASPKTSASGNVA